MMNKIEQHYKEVQEIYPNNIILGCFLIGSQNYGLNIAESDVDTRVFIIPNLEDLACGKQMTSETIILENQEHIDVKDVRLGLQSFRKQSINALEILFTPYGIINHDYSNYWKTLLKYREIIGHYNPKRVIQSTLNMAKRRYSGQDIKSMSNFVRLVDFMENYINGKSFEYCLQCSDTAKEMRQNLIEDDELQRLYVRSKNKFLSIENYLQKIVNKDNKEVDNLLKQVQIQIIEHSLRNELNIND